MRKSPIVRAVAVTGAISVLLTACSGTPGESPTDAPPANETTGTSDGTTYGTREVNDGTTTFTIVDNPGDGPTLSFSNESGFELLEEVDGELTYAFKDMNGNGALDTWEDWRVEAAERAADLAPQLAVEQAAGLMLFSSHERSPSDGLTSAQETYLSESWLRNVLHAGPSDVEASVTWANEMQAFVETLVTDETPYMPVSINSDPRSDAVDSYAGAAGGVSQWPSSLGLAATFDPARVLEFAQIASAEYRALGMSNALSPQIDIATEPRWLRNNGTFGEDPDMAAEMAAAYVEGFQNTYDEEGNPVGWGQGSVATMIKHWPGDGRGEGGRESHTNAGKFAVATGDALAEHVKPFEAGLDAAGLMTSYSILTDAEGNPAYGDELVGSAYNFEAMRVLREDLGYDGVVVTDWGVLNGGPTDPDSPFGMAWGVQELHRSRAHLPDPPDRPRLAGRLQRRRSRDGGARPVAGSLRGRRARDRCGHPLRSDRRARYPQLLPRGNVREPLPGSRALPGIRGQRGVRPGRMAGAARLRRAREERRQHHPV